MQPLLNIAIQAARRAGEIIVRGMNRVHRLDVRAKGQNDFVSEIDTQAEREIIDTVHKPLSAARVPRRGKRPERPGQRVRVDHRSARRHHEFPARLSAVRGVDRRAAARPHGARGRLRPDAPGAVHRLARRRCAARRQAHPRQPAHRPGARADRHRLSVSHRTCNGSTRTWRCSRPSCRQPPAFAVRAPRRSIWLMSRPAGSTHSGSWACRRGTPPPERC